MKKIIMSKDLKFPIEVAMETLGFMARRGGGKTYTAGVMVEGLLKVGAQVVVLDPIGNWWGLRLAVDGKKPGIDIPVIGGDHGDLPIDPSSGKILANLIVEKGISCVLDVSEFSKTKFKQFVYEFATRLFQLKKSHRSPIHIVFEEAQLVAPQRIDRDEGKMMGAIESLIRQGRNYGIGSSLISQRPQSVHKDVLSQVEILLVGQINGKHERDAIQNWVVEKGIDSKEMVKQLPSLPIGTFFVWSPQWLKIFKKIKIGKKKTYDASSTPTFSTKKTEPMSLKPVDMEAVKEAMSQISEKAKKENPHFLKGEVQRLTQENAQLERQNKRQEKTIREYQEKTPKASICNHGKTIPEKTARAIHDMLNKAIVQLQSGINHDTTKPTAKINTPDRKPTGTPPGSSGNGYGSPKGGAGRMAKVLAQVYPRKLTKAQLGTLAGLRHTSGTFGTYLSEIRAHGFFEIVDGLYQATQYCVHFYENAEPIPTDPGDLLEFWKGKFSGGAVRMLDILAKAGVSISRQELGDRAGISSGTGTLGTYLSSLVSNSLVERDDAGYLKICDSLAVSG